MEKRMIRIMGIIKMLCIVISCGISSEDYQKVLESKSDSNNTIIVKTMEKRNKIILSYAYDGEVSSVFYYVKKDGEFYECDENFSLNSIDNFPQFSVKKEHVIFNGKSPYHKITIKKREKQFVTENRFRDSNGTFIVKYDKNYKIKRIELNHKVYE